MFSSIKRVQNEVKLKGPVKNTLFFGKIIVPDPSWATAPHLIEFMYSFNIEVSHVTLINTPFWTVHPYICKGFLAHHVWIINPSNVTNTDGIDPDSTQDVLIHNVYINTGDDGIAIKSGWDEYGYDVVNISSRNITIRDSTITTPCAAISVGSEMSGGVADVYFLI